MNAKKVRGDLRSLSTSIDCGVGCTIQPAQKNKTGFVLNFVVMLFSWLGLIHHDFVSAAPSLLGGKK